MTLKEKFALILMEFWSSDWESKCEQEADEFAIGFAEWNSYKYKYLPNKGWFGNSYELEMGIFKSSKELLEIYKKEKGL
jgi:hypothetical protein